MTNFLMRGDMQEKKFKADLPTDTVTYPNKINMDPFCTLEWQSKGNNLSQLILFIYFQ